MTNEAGIIIICLPFCGSRAGQVRDVSGWSLVLPRACSEVVVRSGWRFAESRVVGGDGLMTRAGNQPRSLYSKDDRSFRVFDCCCACVVREAWRPRFLGSCWRWMLTASWCRIAGSDLGRPGCLLSACRQGDQRQPLCDELGGYPEMSEGLGGDEESATQLNWR